MVSLYGHRQFSLHELVFVVELGQVSYLYGRQCIMLEHQNEKQCCTTCSFCSLLAFAGSTFVFSLLVCRGSYPDNPSVTTSNSWFADCKNSRNIAGKWSSPMTWRLFWVVGILSVGKYLLCRLPYSKNIKLVLTINNLLIQKIPTTVIAVFK